MRSARGSSPKMASETVTEPDSLPSSVVTFSSMSRTLPGLAVHRHRSLGCVIRKLEFAGLRRAVRQFLLHGITHRDPAASDAGHGALDQNQTPLDIGLHHLQIERGYPLDAEMAGHLLVLESFAGILAAAGRTVRTMRNRHAVAGAQTGKIPALHGPGPALAGGGARDVHILSDHEVIGGDLGADWDQRIRIDAELGELALRLDLGNREVAAISFRRALHLASAGAELQRDIAVLLFGAVADHLAIGEAKHRHRHMFAGIGEHPRHSDLLGQDSGTHVAFLPRP